MKKCLPAWTLTALLFMTTGAARAEEPPKPPSPEEMSRQMEKTQQEMKKLQEQEMEQLKKTSPEQYQKRKSSLELQQQINSILTAFQQGTLSAADAERKLTPLVRQLIEDQTKQLGTEIGRLEKKLDSLRKAKANPDLLVKKQVDMLLGRVSPTSDDFSP